VQRMAHKARNVISHLFQLFIDDEKLLPLEMQARLERRGEEKPRVIADYIAGMTDRYAITEYERLTDPRRHTT
jgi:dGTPase